MKVCRPEDLRLFEVWRHRRSVGSNKFDSLSYFSIDVRRWM